MPTLEGREVGVDQDVGAGQGRKESLLARVKRLGSMDLEDLIASLRKRRVEEGGGTDDVITVEEAEAPGSVLVVGDDDDGPEGMAIRVVGEETTDRTGSSEKQAKIRAYYVVELAGRQWAVGLAWSGGEGAAAVRSAVAEHRKRLAGSAGDEEGSEDADLYVVADAGRGTQQWALGGSARGHAAGQPALASHIARMLGEGSHAVVLPLEGGAWYFVAVRNGVVEPTGDKCLAGDGAGGWCPAEIFGWLDEQKMLDAGLRCLVPAELKVDEAVDVSRETLLAGPVGPALRLVEEPRSRGRWVLAAAGIGVLAIVGGSAWWVMDMVQQQRVADAEADRLHQEELDRLMRAERMRTKLMQEGVAQEIDEPPWWGWQAGADGVVRCVETVRGVSVASRAERRLRRLDAVFCRPAMDGLVVETTWRDVRQEAGGDGMEAVFIESERRSADAHRVLVASVLGSDGEVRPVALPAWERLRGLEVDVEQMTDLFQELEDVDEEAATAALGAVVREVERLGGEYPGGLMDVRLPEFGRQATTQKMVWAASRWEVRGLLAPSDIEGWVAGLRAVPGVAVTEVVWAAGLGAGRPVHEWIVRGVVGVKFPLLDLVVRGRQMLAGLEEQQ